MNKQSISWVVYERCVAAFAAHEFDDLKLTVQPNVKIVGSLSGVKRQIDVLVDSRWNDGVDRRIIIDAKDRKRKVDVKDIESFEGMMKDCRASRGVLVCTHGYTEGAVKRAQEAITINVFTLDEILDFQWAYEKCLGICSQSEHNKKPTKRGMVLWVSYMGIPSGTHMRVFQTGKCDGCHAFHVWCWECGLKFSVSDRSSTKCECGHDWISWPDDSENETSMQLMLRVDDQYGAIIDRRPTR
ncbi:MAG: restriction endonuclease [Ardenticatenaceae bacterium]|nr:restriction endonuclease [Anaerolineales bacterium]MCB8941907.1 restriction endonuclease [Ardenticatenaceae bacterium]MCB8973021.1 restriction endonuclease [Ardenticatenaceae bacterium]